MNRNKYIEDFINFFLIILVFTLPFGVYPHIFYLLGLVILILAIKTKSRNLDKFNGFETTYFLLFFVLFITDLIDFNLKLKVWEIYLPLLLFPASFYIIRVNNIQINRRAILNLLNVSIVGTFILNFIISISLSTVIIEDKVIFDPEVLSNNVGFFRSVNYGGNYFFGINFSNFIHPSYISLYIVIATIFTIFQNYSSIRIKSILLVIYSLYIYLLASKAGIISFAFVLFVFSGYYAFKHKRYFLLVVMLLITVPLFIKNPRVSLLIKQITNNEIYFNENSQYSSNIRLLTWKSSIDLIYRNFWTGVGLSNSQEELSEYYKKSNYVHAEKNKYNSHNQFLAIFLASGIFGFISLILTMFFPAFQLRSYKHKNLFFLVISVIFINFIFENFLARYNGMVFLSLLYFVPTLKNKQYE